MNYKCTYLKPDEEKVFDAGTMNATEAFDFFKNYDWQGELRRMDSLAESQIHYSPSVKIDDVANKRWVELSAVGTENEFIFYIFYKRQKEVKMFFGLSKRMDDNHVSEKYDVSIENTHAFLSQFFCQSWDELENFF